MTPPAQTPPGPLWLSLRAVAAASPFKTARLKPIEPGAARQARSVTGQGWRNANSGGTALDAIPDFILGDVFETHIGIAMLRQPALGGIAAFGKVKQLGVVGMVL